MRKKAKVLENNAHSSLPQKMVFTIAFVQPGPLHGGSTEQAVREGARQPPNITAWAAPTPQPSQPPHYTTMARAAPTTMACAASNTMV